MALDTPGSRDECIHVIPAQDGRWLVQKGYSLHPTARFCAKGLAEAEARRQAAEEQVGVVVHDRDGTVRKGER